MTASAESAAARPASIETRASWGVAVTALGIYTVSFGAPVVTVVALKAIAAELGDSRSVPALAFALAWFGAAVGGLPMGWLAERIGIRPVVALGAVMIAAGLAISTLGGEWALYIGHGLFIGLLGNGCINAPLYVYVARWFDRRRGSAMALISSGQYLAGTLWPVFFERGIAAFGWRGMMLAYGVCVIALVVPVAAVVFRTPPEAALGGAFGGRRARRPCSGCARTSPSACCAPPASCAACRWRCRRVISCRSAPISGSRRRTARR